LWLWLFRRRSRLPLGLLYTLTDLHSIRRARRRVVLALWLPAILSTSIVLAGSSVTVEYDVRIWYHGRDDPQRTPLRDVSESERDVLYNFNFHLLLDFWFQPPSSWV
jgi:hypothetical protein